MAKAMSRVLAADVDVNDMASQDLPEVVIWLVMKFSKFCLCTRMPVRLSFQHTQFCNLRADKQG